MNALAQDERTLPTSDEAGTPPNDRAFRPDVEGLRAVAVLLVVFYHAGVPRVTGGFVGVDVFFVISGFVITGLLLRERQGSGRTSILNFYARRVRRILPAATLVILAAVAASYLALGYVSGNIVANDGRWAAVFLSNFHFEAVGTNYFTASLPPSPLQNYWSLSVEEQFYVVYPTLFMLVASLKGRLSLHVKLAITLVVVIVASYWLSVEQTASHPTAAYFSPFTRAWELALGALVAIGTPWLKRVPVRIAALSTWTGLAAIAAAAFIFTAQTAYPGSLVAIPVVGAALVIAGGVVAARFGTERILGLRPFQWFGKRSYSLYLWHWPILIIAAEHAGKSTLSLRENLVLVLVAIGISMASYRLVENPVRHWKLPSRTTVAAGIAMVVTTVTILSLVISVESAPEAVAGVATASDVHVVLQKVAAAKSITKVPGTIDPGLAQAATDYGGIDEDGSCEADVTQSKVKLCFLGDVHAHRLLIVYGDSHALMWLPAFISIATKAHMKLLVLGKPDCPASLIAVAAPQGIGSPGSPYVACNMWHKWAVKTIKRLSPSILVVSQDSLYQRPYTSSSTAVRYTPSQWRNGLAALFKILPSSRTEKIFLGNIPMLAKAGPSCLSTHLNDAQACSTPVTQAYEPFDATEFSTATSSHVRFIDPTPWFCSTVCTAIVGPYDVYMDQFHVSAVYATYLQNALAQALFGSAPTTAPSYGNAVPEMVTVLATPSNGATLSGGHWLDATAGWSVASATTPPPIVTVYFRLTGEGVHSRSICTSKIKSSFGWLCYWNTANVTNGRYMLQSVASDAAGKSVRSSSISISVKN